MTMTMKRALLVLLTASLYAPESVAFVSRPSLAAALPKTRPRTTQRLSMYLDGHTDDLAVLAAPILSSTIAIPYDSLASTFMDPAVESELFNDAAHVGLDLSTMLRPATALLRLSIVIGRICAILSDYLPDGRMNPEEIVFQTIMLLLASGACLQSCLPLLLAATAKLSYRDGRAYTRMFQSLGITWTQYKAMVAVALDWVQLEPHEYIRETNDDKYMYMLYSGDTQLRCPTTGKSVQNITASTSGYSGLLGELKLAQLLDFDKSSQQEEATIDPTIQAGGTGATLLRINIKKLKMLMDQDTELSESIKSLLVKGMHEKLSALMKENSSKN